MPDYALLARELSAARRMPSARPASIAQEGSSISRAGPPILNEQCPLMGSFSRISIPGSAAESSRASKA